MAKISKKTALAGLAAAGVLSVGIAAPAIAFADGATPSPSTSSNAPRTGGEQKREGFAAALAEELGIPQDKVEAALAKVRQQFQSEKRSDKQADKDKTAEERRAERREALKTRLDKAVADGKLTQAEVDAILKAFDAGVLPGPGGGHGMRGHWGGDDPATR